MSYQGQSPKVNRLRLNPRSSDPVNPAEGDLQYADGSVREEGVWVYKNSAWVKVGSGQSGDINYITNGDAEAGNTSGWSLGNVTLTNKFPSGVPTFGSGAAGTLSFTNSSSSAIAGTRSFVLADSAATTAGNFLASDAFTIDSADLAKVLSIDVTYSVTSGTINASGTSSNSLGIAIYDVTASQWIMPAGVWAITQTSGVGRAVATFQTPITSTQYRLVLFNANATSGAVSLKLDRIAVSPVSIPVGAPVTDWIDAGTVTITATTTNPTKGTTATDKVRWRRVGDSAEIRYEFRQTTAGTAGSGVYLLSLPSGLVIDTNKISVSNDTTANYAASVAATASLGEGLITDSSSRGALIARAYSSTQLVLQTQVYYSSANLWGTTGNYALNAAALGVSVTVRVPIAGWSSQVQMSSDTDTRVVALNATQSSQALTANVTNISFTAVKDTHGSWNGTQYTVPVTGDYVVGMAGVVNTSTAFQVYINGVANNYIGGAYSTASIAGGGSIIIPNLKGGDLISVRCNTSVTLVSGNLSIHRLSGPSVVAATETVACRYTTTATISNTTAYTVLPYATKDYDTHGSYNTGTGVYTAPVTGKFLVSAQYAVTQGSQPILYMAIYKNGSLYSEWNSQYSSSTAPITINMTDTLNLNAGDTISIYMKNSVGAVNIQTTAGRNFLNILKIGN